MTLRRALLALVVIAVLLAGGVYTYVNYFAVDETAAPEGQATAAATVAAERVAALGGVPAEGRILPLRQATLAFTASGAIAEIVAAEGSPVAAGDPILRLDDAEQQAALRGATAGLARANANRDAAAAAVDAARTAVAEAELGVRVAAAELALAAAAPRPEEIALAESGLALAEARLAAAAAAQAQVLEGGGTAAVRAAEAELAAAEAAALPARLRLEDLRAADDPDADDLAEAERAQAAAQSAIEAARIALAEVEAGATAAQRAAVAGGVGAAAAARDAAQAELDLALAGGSAEAVTVAQAGADGASAALAEAQARLTAAEAAAAQAEAAVMGAEAAVTAAQSALADRTLAAPFAGVVADLPLAVGEVVAAGAPAAVVADLSGWLIETTDLREADAVRVAVGAPAVARADALPGDQLTGAVTAVGGVAGDDQGDTVYPVTIRLDPTDAPLRWGMTVFATIDPEGEAEAVAAATPDEIVAEGIVLPATAAELAFATGGVVAEVVAAEGQAVAAGEPLVRLDDSAVAAALAGAEADLAAAEAALAAARAGAALAAAGQQTATAGLAAAEARLAQTQAGARAEERLAAERQVAAAEAGLSRAAAERDAALDVSGAAVGAAEAQVAAALSRLTALQQAYDTILTTCVTLPDGEEICPLLGAPEENARAQVAAAEAAYAAAQLALAEARAGATAGETRAADATVAVAAAQRDAAAAQLALLEAGARPEQVELAAIGVERAQLGQERAVVAATEADAAVAQAEAGVEAAAAGVDAAHAALDRHVLVAPFAGVATTIDVEAGELVAPGVAVVRLASPGWVVETSDLVELDAPFVSEGQAAEVTLDALPGETLHGTVIDVGRAPETARGDVVYRVRVALDDTELPLRWGMTAVVRMTNDE